MSSLTITGLAFTGFMVLLALFAYTGKRLNQNREIDAKEIKKYKRGAHLASKNKEYMRSCKEMGNEGVELYE